MYIYYNPNPLAKYVGDCVVRALTKVLDKDWDYVYDRIYEEGRILKDMPSSNSVWGAYLKSKGFSRHIIPNSCPNCYSVTDFCKDNPKGTFVLGLDGHVIAVIDGNYYDTQDSGFGCPIYYWKKEK